MLTQQKNRADAIVALTEAIKDLTLHGFECYTPMSFPFIMELVAVRKKDNKQFRLAIEYVWDSSDDVEIFIQSRFFSKLGRRSSKFDNVDGVVICCKSLDAPIYVQKDQINLYGNVFKVEVTKMADLSIHYTDFIHIESW